MVNVTDSNDNRPIFSIPPGGYEVTISENVTVGSDVITVIATDLDQGPNQIITYSILANISDVPVPFSISDPTVSHNTTPLVCFCLVAHAFFFSRLAE